jgi:hypothetical protein
MALPAMALPAMALPAMALPAMAPYAMAEALEVGIAIDPRPLLPGGWRAGAFLVEGVVLK